MPDGRMAGEWFGNLKAQLWWTAEMRSRRHMNMFSTWRATKTAFLTRKTNWILLPDCNELIGQISIPKWGKNDKGKIVIETKKQLAMRGVPSPDYAIAWFFAMRKPIPASASHQPEKDRNETI